MPSRLRGGSGVDASVSQSARASRADHGWYPRAMTPGTSASAPPSRGIEILPSVCPHDCTSTCALDVERIDARTIGRIRGSMRNTYTRGVICEKVGRYAERVHHPDRLLHPLRRVGPKGSGRFERISWDDALDTVADAFTRHAARLSPETGWPEFVGCTKGDVTRVG